MDPYELRFQALDEKISSQEEMCQRKLDHFEERLRQVNQKFDRVEQLGDRIESLNKLIDTLKSNFDAKLMVFEDKYQQVQSKVDKKIQSALEKYVSSKKHSEDQDIQQMYSLLKKTVSVQKELQQEVQQLKSSPNTNNFRQSEIIKRKNVDVHQYVNNKFKEISSNQTGILKQSNTINIPNNNPISMPPYKSSKQQNDKIAEQQKQRSRNESSTIPLATEEDEDKKTRTKSRREDENMVDKYQFTLQSKILNENTNQQGLQTCKSQQSQLKSSSYLIEQRERIPSKGSIQMRKGFESDKLFSQNIPSCIHLFYFILIRDTIGIREVNSRESSLPRQFVNSLILFMLSSSRSKFLNNERISGQFKSESDQQQSQQSFLVRDQLKNMKK